MLAVVDERRHRSAGALALGENLVFTDVAGEVGLEFRHGAFRWDVSGDPPAMMGGGVCWIDYDDDGWLDLFVVDSYAEEETGRWEDEGGLPRSALFHNERGRFVDVSAGSGVDLPLRGTGCVAADLDLDGFTDLYVTSATTGALLWNRGNGTFSEGARAASVAPSGWYAGAAVGDVNGDGLPDLFLAGYADLNYPIPEATQGFPKTYLGVRDLLYLNEGDGFGRPTFREAGAEAGLEVVGYEYGLGATFLDVEGDGDLDLYVANDTNPNRLYGNVPWPGGAEADPLGLGFRFEDLSGKAGVADPNSGMGVAMGTSILPGAKTFSSPTRALRSTRCTGRWAGCLPRSRTSGTPSGRISRVRRVGASRGEIWISTPISISCS